MRYRFIRDHREEFPVDLMCRTLEVGRSGFYAWLARPLSPRNRENRRLVAEIHAIHRTSGKTYGSPRVHAELKARGYSCGKNRVARLMRASKIFARHKRKFKATTDSTHSYPVFENKLQRRFAPSAPNQSWAADITYIPTKEGWLYLAVTMDLYSRHIIGWAMDRRMTRQLVLGALTMALKKRQPEKPFLHHSDRGSQYACHDFQALLARHGIQCSMSRKGNCWDNAVMESFFHTLKVEQVHDQDYLTREQAKADIFEYIEVFYNRKRRHSYLGYLSPVEFEKLAQAA